MKYNVKARYKENLLKEFYEKLTSGEIENQKPDGKEILASMKRAVITENNTIEWTETCFCPAPLKHERETVYDKYFDHMETIEIDKNEEIDFIGTSFWETLKGE